MSELKRVIDKYAGQKFCDLLAEDQEEYLSALAQRGAFDALKALGLDDANASVDLRDLRDLLKGFRLVRKNAITTVLGGMGRVIGWMILVALAGWTLHAELSKKEIIGILSGN